MESSGAGALARPAARSIGPDVSSATVTEDQPHVEQHSSPRLLTQMPDQPNLADADQTEGLDDLEEPEDHVTNAGYVSAPDSDVRRAANMLVANGGLSSYQDQGLPGSFDLHLPFDSDPYPIDSLEHDAAPTGHQPQSDMQAYAMLKFPDGDFLVTTHSVTIGRDMNAYKQHLRQKKQEKRAARDVRRYQQEEEAHQEEGLNGEGELSKSSESLQGRPGKSLPSNFSEPGGAVAYNVSSDEEDDDDRKDKRRRRRQQLISKSSSTTSVAPANLHTNPTGDMSFNNPFWAPAPAGFDQSVHLPVHPQDPEDMKRISREHLEIRYNYDDEQWELSVIGNGVIFNGERYARDSVVPLQHNDEILLTTVQFNFKLPDAAIPDADAEDESEDEKSVLSTSPARKLGLAVTNGFGDSDAEDEEDEQASGDEDAVQPIRPKLKKLKLKIRKSNNWSKPKKKPSKAAAVEANPAKKEKGKKKDSPTEEPEETPQVVEKKGKNPKKAAKEPKESKADPDAEVTEPASVAVKDTKPSETPAPPVLPENLPPGSVFEGVAPEELPQKRKGPGRPPKNGLMSKRDEALVKRKRRELEKAGLVVPTLDELVAIVRAESKLKEQQGKQAEGQNGVQVVNSIEMPDGDKRMSIPSNDLALATQSGASATSVKRSSPKPRKPLRSPSPQKAESEYTEEELKKPSATYVVLIDEALRNHQTGIMDLQEIYDRIQKKYPYYKYKAGSSGWQSSVRHNLISCGRFEEAGKQGKGRLWKINWDFNIDSNKKRKQQTPPPMPQQQYMPHNQMGAGGMGGAPPPNGQQFGQPGAYGGPYGPPQNGPPAFTPAPPPPAGAGTYYSPYAPSQPPQGSSAGPYPNPANAPNAPPGMPQPPPFAGGAQPQNFPVPPQGLQHHQQRSTQSPMNGLAHATPPTGPPAHSPPGPPQSVDVEQAARTTAMVDEIMLFRTEYIRGSKSPEDKLHREDLFRRMTARVSGPPVSDFLMRDEAILIEALTSIIHRHEKLAREALDRGQPGPNGTPQPPVLAGAAQTANREVAAMRSAAGNVVAKVKETGGSQTSALPALKNTTPVQAPLVPPAQMVDLTASSPKAEISQQRTIDLASEAPSNTVGVKRAAEGSAEPDSKRAKAE